MAKQVQVHSFKRIRDDLASDNIKNVLMFYGREHYLIRWSVDQIKARYVNPVTEMFDFMKIDGTMLENPGEIMDACETMPMMSERRVVLVEDFTLNAEGMDEMADYIAALPESTMLILACGAPDKRRKLFKTVQKCGAEYDFDVLDMPQLKSFISKRFRSAGKNFMPDVTSFLAEASGYYDKDSDYTLDNLINDIDKIIAHSGDTITNADVEETVAGNVDRNVFAFSDALAAGRKGEALNYLRVLMAYGENTFKILGLICSQFELLLMVNEMRRDGMTPAQMHSQVGIHEYRLKKAMPLASKYSAQHLRNILMRAYEADRNIKSGITEQDTALELLVAMI